MTMRVTLAIVLAFAGCKEKDQAAAKEIAGNVKDKTVELAGNAKDKVVEVAGTAKDRVGAVAEATGDIVDGALVKGKQAKAELDKVYKSKADYDLAIDEVSSEAATVHAARLEKMPSIEVKGVRVGYEEDSTLSLRGTTYMKHFRASWKRPDGKIVRVSFFTKETLDVVAFAELLRKLVPAVEAVL